MFQIYEKIFLIREYCSDLNKCISPKQLGIFRLVSIFNFFNYSIYLQLTTTKLLKKEKIVLDSMEATN